MIINPTGDEPPKELPHFNSTTADGELVGFKIVTKRWSQVKAIFAETGQPLHVLMRALKEGHGITIIDKFEPEDDMIDNPFLFFIVSEEQMALMRKHDITAPTFLQLLGTSECIDTNEERLVQRFREMKGDPRA